MIKVIKKVPRFPGNITTKSMYLQAVMLFLFLFVSAALQAQNELTIDVAKWKAGTEKCEQMESG